MFVSWIPWNKQSNFIDVRWVLASMHLKKKHVIRVTSLFPHSVYDRIQDAKKCRSFVCIRCAYNFTKNYRGDHKITHLKLQQHHSKSKIEILFGAQTKRTVWNANSKEKKKSKWLPFQLKIEISSACCYNVCWKHYRPETKKNTDNQYVCHCKQHS